MEKLCFLRWIVHFRDRVVHQQVVVDIQLLIKNDGLLKAVNRHSSLKTITTYN